MGLGRGPRRHLWPSLAVTVAAFKLPHYPFLGAGAGSRGIRLFLMYLLRVLARAAGRVGAGHEDRAPSDQAAA